MNIKRFMAILAVLALFSGVSAEAATVNISDNYSLGPAEVVPSNAYVIGGTTVVSGRVSGDLLSISADSTVSGEVGGDALNVGGVVEWLAPIGGDLRIAGGRISATETIGGDLVMVGGSVTVLSDAEVAGDALIAGGQVKILGDIRGDLYAAGGQVFIDGHVAGKVHIYEAGKVIIGEHAQIDGELSYASNSEADISPSAVISGGIVHKLAAPLVAASDAKSFIAGLFGLVFILRILILGIGALFFVMVFRKLSTAAVSAGVDSFWKNVLIGFAVMVSLPVASVLLIFTILGAAVGLAALIAWLLLVLGACVFSGVVFGWWAQKHLTSDRLPAVVPWYTAVLGVALLQIIALVPYVGWIFTFVFFLNAFGILSSAGYKHFFTGRK